ncbi:hypothetical protein F7725_018739 [Dissostichus mawsoni]|uniref:Uncharacterized protein n=1 Tax=Dissostichus mawsoni TaxID=36200 RepID=A0A7J5XSF5_DISMA|nr:hypothetical protein F7725_018739 [Dissostichus mawsoni]
MEDHFQPRPRYCRINLSVPVLDRFFNDQDTRPDSRLSRESLNVLLDLLGQDRRHGWGATIETLVFLFWLASGASCRVVSRVFGMPRSTVHQIVHRVTEEVVAIRHQAITACAVLHNICIGAGDIMAPEEDIVEDVAEDEGGECVGGSQWCSLAGPTVCGGFCPGGAPPTRRHQGPNCGSPSRSSSSTTWDSLLSLNAVMALPQPDPRPPPLGPPLLNLAVACPLE